MAMFPSILPNFDRKNRKRSVRTTGIQEYVREESPDAHGEEILEDFESYIKTKIDIDSSLALLRAFTSSVSRCK